MAELKKRSNECMKCESCGVTQNCSGYECYCFKKTRRGRLIAWQYGLDMGKCLKWLTQYIKRIRCPSWCPKEKEGDAIAGEA